MTSANVGISLHRVQTAVILAELSRDCLKKVRLPDQPPPSSTHGPDPEICRTAASRREFVYS